MRYLYDLTTKAPLLGRALQCSGVYLKEDFSSNEGSDKTNLLHEILTSTSQTRVTSRFFNKAILECSKGSVEPSRIVADLSYHAQRDVKKDVYLMVDFDKEFSMHLTNYFPNHNLKGFSLIYKTATLQGLHLLTGCSDLPVVWKGDNKELEDFRAYNKSGVIISTHQYDNPTDYRIIGNEYFKRKKV